MTWMRGRLRRSQLALPFLVAGPRTDLLDLEARRRLHEYVSKYPGLHLREIARATGLEMNHAKYHLLYMQKHGLISSRREEGYWRFFPLEEGRVGWRDQVPAQSKAILGLLRRPIPLHVTLLLLDGGELNQSQLLERVTVAPSTLHYHLAHMERVGLMVSERRGRERICRLSDPKRVLDLLIRYRPPPALVADFLEAWENLDFDALVARHEATPGQPAPQPDALGDEGLGALQDAQDIQESSRELAVDEDWKEKEKASDASLRGAAAGR